MFGITGKSNSVAIHVHNFTPYFYVKVNTSVVNLGPDDLDAIKEQLNKWVLSSGSSNTADHPNGGGVATPVRQIDIIYDKAPVMHYQTEKSVFLRIYTGLPKYVNQLRSLFENGSFTYPRQGRDGAFETVTYESNLPYALRFMIDNGIVGMSWIKIKAGKYRIR